MVWTSSKPEKTQDQCTNMVWNLVQVEKLCVYANNTQVQRNAFSKPCRNTSNIVFDFCLPAKIHALSTIWLWCVYLDMSYKWYIAVCLYIYIYTYIRYVYIYTMTCRLPFPFHFHSSSSSSGWSWTSQILRIIWIWPRGKSPPSAILQLWNDVVQPLCDLAP